MLKTLLLLPCLLIACSNFAQSKELVLKVTTDVLKNYKSEPGHFFEVDLRDDGGLKVYHAIDENAVKYKRDSLEKDGRKQGENLCKALNVTINLEGYNITMYYFDKASFSKGLICHMQIQNDRIVSFESVPLEKDVKFRDDDPDLYTRLHNYSLAPNQYVIPMYDGKGFLKSCDCVNAVCLTTIVDNLTSKDWSSDSKKEYERFAQVVKPAKVASNIVIRYQNKYGEDAKVFTYPIN